MIRLRAFNFWFSLFVFLNLFQYFLIFILLVKQEWSSRNLTSGTDSIGLIVILFIILVVWLFFIFVSSINFINNGCILIILRLVLSRQHFIIRDIRLPRLLMISLIFIILTITFFFISWRSHNLSFMVYKCTLFFHHFFLFFFKFFLNLLF